MTPRWAHIVGVVAAGLLLARVGGAGEPAPEVKDRIERAVVRLKDWYTSHPDRELPSLTVYAAKPALAPKGLRDLPWPEIAAHPETFYAAVERVTGQTLTARPAGDSPPHPLVLDVQKREFPAFYAAHILARKGKAPPKATRRLATQLELPRETVRAHLSEAIALSQDDAPKAVPANTEPAPATTPSRKALGEARRRTKALRKQVREFCKRAKALDDQVGVLPDSEVEALRVRYRQLTYRIYTLLGTFVDAEKGGTKAASRWIERLTKRDRQLGKRMHRHVRPHLNRIAKGAGKNKLSIFGR